MPDFAKVFFCDGCSKATPETWTATGYKCPVYADKTVLPWYRHPGEHCAFNQPKVAIRRGKIRVGQQKQSKRL